MQNINLLPEQFAQIVPSAPLRVSSYTILVPADNIDKYVVAHGCSGALFPVDKSCFDWLSNGADPVKKKSIPKETVLKLLNNGILTNKSHQQERSEVKDFLTSYFNWTEASDEKNITVILSYDCNFRCTYICTCTDVNIDTYIYIYI